MVRDTREEKMKKIGLLAGAGHLPCEFAKAVTPSMQVVAVGLVEAMDPQLREHVVAYREISAGQLEAIIDFLKAEDIKEVTMLGKVTKELLFQENRPVLDARFMQLLAGLPNQKDDTLMLAFVQELAKEGIKVLDQTAALRILMPKVGCLTKKQPNAREQKDIEFGFTVAKAIGKLDIGQTVVVKNAAIMAVEAIEGTDACILRGGNLAGGEAVIVKTAKPQQDNRFDVPAVGMKTLDSMLEVRATVLAIEAEKTLFVDRENVLKKANENNIVIVAM